MVHQLESNHSEDLRPISQYGSREYAFWEAERLNSHLIGGRSWCLRSGIIHWCSPSHDRTFHQVHQEQVYKAANHRKSVKLTLHSWTFMINLIEYVRLVWDRELSCDKWYTFVQVRCVLIMWFINYVCALQPNKKKYQFQQKSFKCQGCRNRNSAGCNLR